MLLLILLLPFTFADYGQCTTWKKEDHVYCYFTNKKADVWIRNCSNYYDITQLCTLENPNLYINSCSTWRANPGITCLSEGRLRKQWLRTCSVDYKTTEFCDDKIDPNDLDI